jgi:hypothetical protein
LRGTEAAFEQAVAHVLDAGQLIQAQSHLRIQTDNSTWHWCVRAAAVIAS